MNNDLISRETAIKAIRNEIIAYKLSLESLLLSHKEREILRNRKAQAIEDIVTIERLPCVEQQGQWTPVTEKLPDINDHYTSDVCLVYCDNGAYAFAELEENIFGQVGWDCEREDDYHEAVGTVIAWMLLPAPYKSGEEE